MILRARATEEATQRWFSALGDPARQDAALLHCERKGITLDEDLGFIAIAANRWDWLESVSGEMVTR